MSDERQKNRANVGSPHVPWWLANSPALSFALPNAYFDSLGIPRVTGGPIA